MGFRFNGNVLFGMLSIILACLFLYLGRVLIGLFGIVTSFQLLRSGLKSEKKVSKNFGT